MKTKVMAVVLLGLMSTAVFAQEGAERKITLQLKGKEVPLDRTSNPPNEVAMFTKCHSEAAGLYSFQLVRKDDPKYNFGIISNAYHYSDDNGHDLSITVNRGTGVANKTDSTHYSMVITLDCRREAEVE